MTPTTLRISEPRELLALIPHQIGFTPTESVVAISIRSPRGKVGLVARVDLADLADIERGPMIARNVMSHLDRDGAQDAIAVIYTATDPRTAGSPALTALHHLRAAAEPLGYVAAWGVTSTGFMNIDCADETCCPPGGRSLTELEASRVGAHLVYAGSAVAPSREDTVQIRPAPADTRRSAGRVRTRWAVKGAKAATDPRDLEKWRRETLIAWRQAVSQTDLMTRNPPGSGIGKLEAGLRDVRVRDAILVALVGGSGRLPERMVRGTEPSPATISAMQVALDRIYTPKTGEPPPAQSPVHVWVLEQVVAHGRRGEQAPALSLLALLAWWTGDGARANVLLERALHDDPDYRLGLLLAQAVNAGIAPGWIAAQREIDRGQ